MAGFYSAYLAAQKQAQQASKSTPKSSSPSSKPKDKIVTTKGTVLPEVLVSSTTKPKLNAESIVPLDKISITSVPAPTAIPIRVSPIPSPINVPTLAKGNFSSFLQNAAIKATNAGKDCQRIIQKGVTQAEDISSLDLCNLITYFLTQALPSGSNIEAQFQTLKKNSQKILDQIQETEEQVLHFPIKKSSIAPPAGIPNTSGSSNSPSAASPQPTNLANSNPNYGGGGGFYFPSTTNIGVASTSGNNGTSAGNGLTVDESLQAIRKVKSLVSSLNVPDAVLKVIPGGGKLVESLKRVNQNVPDNISNFPQQDIKKIFQTFDDLKNILNGIANAQNPADLVKVLAAKNAITKLQDTLNPAKLIPTLNALLVSIQTTNKVLTTLNSYVSKLATITNSLNTVIKVFKTLSKFIRKLPIPNMYTTAGTTSTLSNIAEVIDKKADQAASNVEQTATFLSQLTRSLSGIIARINILIELLVFILTKLEKCDKTQNLPITKKLKEATIELQNNSTKLQNNLPKPPTKTSIQYKGYNLSIIEEEVTDTGIILNRRYGIATDKRGVLALETELTFATNTDLIYNELKYLIDKNGLNADVNANVSQSESDAINAELDIPTDAEQNAELAQTQAEINDALSQVQPIKNMKDKQTKRDKRRIKRLKRVVKRLKAQGFNKAQIQKNRFVKKFTTQEFEDVWNELNQN